MNGKADRVLKNGTFYSVNTDGNLDKFTAVAIKDEKIIYVGDDKSIPDYIGSDTHVEDLSGRMVIPGMSDSHIHASWMSIAKYSVDLYGTTKNEDKTRQDYINGYINPLIEFCKNKPDEKIIRGAGFDAGLFLIDEAGFPTRHDLDLVSQDKPVVVRSYCFHYAWVNSKALELAGINKNTEDPRNGVIMRDENGEPTGFLQEMSAIDLIVDGLPGYDFSISEYKDSIKEYERILAHAYGITMIFDALATKNAMAAYRDLAIEGNLKLRVNGCYYADPTKDIGQFNKLEQNDTSKRELNYTINTVKFFIDGTGLAFFLGEPFESDYLKMCDMPLDYKGYPIWELNEMEEAFFICIERGYQIHIHAMGDAAVTQSLDALEVAIEKSGKTTRNVIAHIMHIKEADIERMAKLNIIAAMQPCWMYVESIYEFYYIALFGKKRSDMFYPMKSFIDKGIKVASGTDYPVTVPPNPFKEMQFAITRSILKSLPDYERYKGQKLGPVDNPSKECLSLKEAIESLTISGAYQHYLEKIAGSLEVGKSADMVILSQNLENIPITDIESTEVEETIFCGETVYKRD